MKEIIIFFLFFNFNWLCFAQPINLVPNPSFEIYDTCPVNIFNPQFNGVDAICRAVPWFQPNAPFIYCSGSSDFFHECTASIPSNCVGYQYAKIGFGYAGAGWGNPDVPFGEYLEVQLIQSMKQKKYCASFYVNTPSVDCSSTNCIQARFTVDTVYQNEDWSQLNLTGGIDANEIVRDTLNWVLIKGIYNANGDEKFMTVGCFENIGWDDFLCSETMGCGNVYYFFDHFGVYELPEISAGMGGEIDTLGESVSLQAICEGCWNDLVYRWWPSEGLSDTTILNPVATPEVTTTYYFGLIDTSETVPCIVDLMDSVTVFVTIPQDTVTPPPTSFSWLVYPSPTNGNLTVQFSGLTSDSQLLVIDARGRLVRKITVPKNTESLPLDISALAAGEYFLRVENSSFKEKRKVTKF